MILTNVYHKTIAAAKGTRIIGNRGGTSSSKTYSNLQVIHTIAELSEKPLTISVVSESMPHLKKGAMKDYFDLLKMNGVYSESNHNKTDSQYKVNNSVIEFFSADSPDKVHGPRRDFLYLNECNHISHTIADQLEIRTKYKIFADWNPNSAFWFEEEWQPRDDCKLIVSTYKDALDVLHPNIVKSIEQRKPVYDAVGNLISGNPAWWKVYGEGEIGRLEGLVFDNFAICDAMPENPKWKATGLDFGFTNDPTGMSEVAYAHGELWIDELLYETGQTNQDIGRHLYEIGKHKQETIADSAEPKSIKELQVMGCNVKAAMKGPDSINSGIDIMKRYKINITKRSLNAIKEFRNYQWQIDKSTGKPINKPVDDFNHLIDSIRYVCLIKIGNTSRIRGSSV